MLPTRIAGLETNKSIAALRYPYSVLLPMGFTLPWPLLAHAVGSYPTISPLPHCGGIFSAALSLGLASKTFPQPGVTRHRVSMEPGLSSIASFRNLRQQSPGQLAPMI